MYTTAITLGALLTSSAIGASLPAPAKFAITRRQSSEPPMSWTNPDVDDGNLIIQVSDDTIGYGTVDPKTVLEGLYDQCWTSGVCDPSSYTRSGAVPGSGGGGSQLILTATPGQGYFPPEDREPLIGSFVAAIEPFTTLEQVTYNPSNCATQGCTYQPPEQMDQYTGPSAMTIVIKDPEGGSPLGSITVSVTSEVAGDGGLCETFTTVGAGVAAAISGPAAGIFTLAGLACQ